MSPPRQVYSSTVSATWLVATGIVAGTVAAVAAAVAGANPVIPIIVGVAIILTFLVVSPVRLVVGPERIVLGWGPLAWPRRNVPSASVVEVATEDLSAAQVFGLGVPWRRRMTRLTVRPGPTLALTLSSGECIRISTPDPPAAARVIRAAHTDARSGPTVSSSTSSDERDVPMIDETARPWFGPKRVGIGIRPQTWQGWLVVLGPAALLVIGVALFTH